jgi:hypothetical protein
MNTIPLSKTNNIGYKHSCSQKLLAFKNEKNLKWYLQQGMNKRTANASHQQKGFTNNHPWKKLEKKLQTSTQH